MKSIKRFVDIDTSNPMIEILLESIESFREELHKFILLTGLDVDQFYSAMNYIFVGYMNNSDAFQAFKNSKDVNLDKLMDLDFKKGMLILEKSTIPFYIEQACSLGIATVVIECLMSGLDSSEYNENFNKKFSLNLNTICRATWLASGSIGDLKARASLEFDNTVNIHLQGAKARSDKYKKKQIQAYSLFQDGNYYSFAECARAIHEALGIKDPNTVARWLSKMNKKT